MSELNHTPGPWIFEPGESDWIQSEDRDADIAMMADTWPTELAGEMYANARLISAAPELLDAARKAMIDNKRVLPSKDEPEWAVALRAAIAKATQS